MAERDEPDHAVGLREIAPVLAGARDRRARRAARGELRQREQPLEQRARLLAAAERAPAR